MFTYILYFRNVKAVYKRHIFNKSKKPAYTFKKGRNAAESLQACTKEHMANISSGM